MIEVILCAVILLGAGIINLMMRKLSIGLFNVFWALVIFICRNELCRDNYAQCFGLILLMILSVNVGFWLGSHRYRFTFLKKRQEEKRQFSTKIMVLLLQITAVIFLYYAVRSIRKFGFDLLIIRAKNNSDSSEKVFSGLIDTILFYGIGVPLTYVGALVCAYNFSQQIKTPQKIYLLLTVNVIGNFLLIPIWRAAGAAVASVATQFFTNFILCLIMRPIRPTARLIWQALNPKLIFEMIPRKEKRQ